MMNYMDFKEETKNRFMEYMPDEMRDMKAYIRRITKINTTLDGLVIFGEGKKMQVSPVIYLDNLYDYYKECGSLEETLLKGVSIMLGAMKENINVPDIPNVRENIVFQVINTIQNQQLLANLPNRPFHDLSIIYRCIVGSDNDNTFSTVINYSIAEYMGFTEEDLFSMAAKNTRRIFPPCVKTMNDVMREIAIKTGMPTEAADIMLGELELDPVMFVISNKIGINGAVSLLYEDELYKLAERLKSDLYILPSSIHECIAVSADIGDPEELACMVAEINANEVDIEERLSNQVYHYDKNLRVLTLATDMSNKSLQYADE
ncbi:MAG: hypothetical protein K2P35_10360 [Lachnospiraceae bacterium]|nr:hypothetical protein [Lachnospiraceae bacterium]